jgi:type II secretory pathway predicted ATPase ExeA
MHPRFKKAYDGILQIIHMASLAALPFGATVIAPSGCGKTALMTSIARAITNDDSLSDNIRSVSVAAEANATVGHLVKKLMRELGYPATVRASAVYEQSSLIASALRERGVKVLFIDEFQHVCRGKRNLSAAGITDWIKQLADDGGVVVILLGTRELKPLIEINDQLSSRAPAHFELKEFDRNVEWAGLLKGLSENVKSYDLSTIHSTFQKSLHVATRGALRPLKQLLMASAGVAIEAEKSALDKASLMIGYERVFGPDSLAANPFQYD